MENSNVTVLFKKGSREQHGNYRPVNLTPVVSKLFGKMVSDFPK